MKTVTEKELNNLSYKEKLYFTGIIKWDDGAISYLKNGITHCEDGPAIIWSNGRGAYFVNGKQYSKLEWLQQTQMFKDVLKYKNL